ncbi:glycosyltransferase family 4 protein [Legionella lytica]|uniref:Glycosyltransferase family 4 protein n=1 Tax=Legionella lytica TaxID=96232 RepID=A0ABW8DA75_9GAMM
MDDTRMKLLIDMRAAAEGFAGIPQEARLIANGLQKIDFLEVDGFLELPYLSAERVKSAVPAESANYHSRIVAALSEKKNTAPSKYFLWRRLKKIWANASMYLIVMRPLAQIKLIAFNAQLFPDFIWRSLFAKTLPASERKLAVTMNYKISPVSRAVLYFKGLKKNKYPIFNTKKHDVFISHMPFPGKVSKDTSLVIRYYDSIPIFMSHTIENTLNHQRMFFSALSSNVKSGAWFVCISETVRQELIQLFPEIEARSSTIHCMISEHYFCEDSLPARTADIIRAYSTHFDAKTGVDIVPPFTSLEAKEAFYSRTLSPHKVNYLLIVSTIEPRKNHLCLLNAWKVLRETVDPSLKLIMVGHIGWNYASILDAFKIWIEKGDLFLLSAVPAAELRVLYRHAIATVCPSFSEGFDYSGVESMSSGGLTVASDIAVHREIYGDAAFYFDPYNADNLVSVLSSLLDSQSELFSQVELMRHRGLDVASRYLPGNILPQWESVIMKIRSQSLVN